MEKINTIGERLKHLRKDLLQLTQKDFAERLHMSDTMSSKFEKNLREVKDRTIADICREFNVNEDWLRDGVGEVFVESDQQVVDEFLKTHNLNEQAMSIVNGFLSLTEKERDTFIETFYKIIKDCEVAQETQSTLQVVESEEDDTEYTRIPLFDDIRVSAGLGNYLDGSVKPRMVTFKLNSRHCKADHAITVNGTSMQPLLYDEQVIYIKEQPALESGEVGIFVYEGELYCKRLILEDSKIILRSENKKYEDIIVNKNLGFVTIGKVLL